MANSSQFSCPPEIIDAITQVLRLHGITGNCIEIGGPFDDVLNQHVSSVVDWILSKSTAIWPLNVPVYYFPIHSNEKNAITFKFANCYIICLTSSMIAEIAQACIGMSYTFPMKNLFQYETEFEVNDLNYLFIDRDRCGSIIINSPSEHAINISWILISGAICVIITHEYGHISNGHLELLRLWEQFITHNGVGIFDNQINDATTRKTLEFDADGCAASGLMSIFNQAHFEESEDLPFGIDQYVKTPHLSLTLLSIAMSSCLFFEDII